jgi:hypothetical protein
VHGRQGMGGASHTGRLEKTSQRGKRMRKQIAAAVLAGAMLLAGGNALADGMERGSIKDVPVTPT